MTGSAAPPWVDLDVPPAELRLDPTLTCGQAFRWKATGEHEWTCALWGHAIDLKQTPSSVQYRSLGRLPEARADVEQALRDYFQLHISFNALCDAWAQTDPDFSRLRDSHTGVRTLRQPVVETLLVFIASSNNNIKRISMLVDRLCQHYGQPIDTEKGRFYTFPALSRIHEDPDIESTLVGLGFGYRAKYYAKSVRLLCTEHTDPEAFLLGLRQEPLDVARAELLKLSGVGPKVADCVCLMALDKTDAVPVDTHIWQVAQRRYVGRVLDPKQGPEMLKLLSSEHRDQAVALARQLKASKAPTAKTYEAAQQLFIHLFGDFAGWAQGLLFSGDLGSESKKTPSKAPTKRKPADPQPTASDRKLRLRNSTK
ncbi:8-oxoguanine glycosylase ogg1 [Coemansia sp. RSA 2711]|nr:8-oxoguanine glycosylase ogg1 [Coemansia sp. RSA 2711]KAJ2731189.1 8-oxoguanine glycosylase ogg1 [Coemansia sp. Cherry 401B]